MPRKALPDWAVAAVLPAAAAGVKAVHASGGVLRDPDPVRWIKNVLGVSLTDYQAAIARAIAEHPRVAVRSCNSVGKDFIAACVGLWWVHQGDDTAVVYTAPTWHQVERIQWRREIKRAFNRAAKRLPGQLLTTSYEVSETQMMVGISTNNKEAMSGVHAARILIIVTEASAATFDKELYEGIDSMLASGDAHLLLLSQPTRQQGQFYEAFHSQAHMWHTMHVRPQDTPNVQACAALGPHAVPNECAAPVVPGLTTHAWVEAMRAKYGQANDFVRVHVDGDFPELGEDAVIPLPWVEAAMEREAEGVLMPVGLGGDIARHGQDACALATMMGRRLAGLEQWYHKSLMETAGRFKRALEAHDSAFLAVDDTGLGGGVTDRLLEQDVEVLAVNFGANADEPEAYANQVSEMWWLGREALDPENPDAITLPAQHPLGQQLAAQLVGAVYKVDSRGKIVVDKMGTSTESPDLADALWLARKAQAHGRRRWILE